MRKKVISALSLCLVLLAMFFVGCAPEEVAQKVYVNVVGLGDSISAGYAPNNTEMSSYYNDYISNRVLANKMSFTYLMGEAIANSSSRVTTRSYAQSGDKTSDLVEKLNDNAVLNGIKNADIITLCIGANNVLGVAINNLKSYLSGEISIEEIETMLQAGVDNFKFDYTNTIMPILTRTDAKIYVMTVYDPYKYFDFSEAQTSGIMSAVVSVIGETFSQFKEVVMGYMKQINDYIKSEKFDNVYVVDVNSAFESLNKQDYAKYLNVNSQNIQINSMNDLNNIASSLYVDPHPTIAGQRYISQLFLNKINL